MKGDCYLCASFLTFYCMRHFIVHAGVYFLNQTTIIKVIYLIWLAIFWLVYHYFVQKYTTSVHKTCIQDFLSRILMQ